MVDGGFVYYKLLICNSFVLDIDCITSFVNLLF